MFWKKQSPELIYPDDIELPPMPDPLFQPGTGSATDLDRTIPPAAPVRAQARAVVSDLETIYFTYDSYVLSDEMVAKLDNNAQWIFKHPGITIQIEGHCDERGSVEYNINLGQKRAETVREYLALMKVDPNLLTTISYGEERPMDRASTEEAWLRNRRVQFFIY